MRWVLPKNWRDCASKNSLADQYDLHRKVQPAVLQDRRKLVRQILLFEVPHPSLNSANVDPLCKL